MRSRRKGFDRRGALSALVALGLSCASCAKSEARASEGGNRLVLTGSSTVAPLASELARRFEERNPLVRIDVQSGGSGRGIADARSGAADLGMASRALKPEEQDLEAHTIALDGIGLIVHASNPIGALTDDQVVSIYTGGIRNWGEVGGRDGEIVVVNKASGRATLELFLEHFYLAEADIRADVVIGENEQGIKTVAGNENAIGYVSIGTASADAESGVPIRLLEIGGVQPSLENVRTGAYPLVRPLNLVSRGAPNPLALRFVEFARSPEVHDLVRAQYFVPLVR